MWWLLVREQFFELKFISNYLDLKCNTNIYVLVIVCTNLRNSKSLKNLVEKNLGSKNEETKNKETTLTT